jgi:hypothetical protein
MKYVFVRRLRDNAVLDIPEGHVEMTLKRGGFELVEDSVDQEYKPTIPNLKPAGECPFCGKTAKHTHA